MKKKSSDIIEDEVVETEEVVTSVKGKDSGLKVKSEYKDYKSFVVNNIVVNVVDGKVYCSGENAKALVEGGFVE